MKTKTRTIDQLPAGRFNAVVDTISFASGRSYKFSFEQVGRVWRAYILSQPSYGSRSNGLHATHRQMDGTRYYVCWTPEPTSQSEVRTVTDQWSRRTERYLDYGTAIEK